MKLPAKSAFSATYLPCGICGVSGLLDRGEWGMAQAYITGCEEVGEEEVWA